MSAKIRGAKYEIARTGGARTQQGLPQDVKAQIAYWKAYMAFLEHMSRDPRFLVVSKWV